MKRKRIISTLLIIMMLLTLIPTTGMNAEAAKKVVKVKKVKINKSSVTLTEGKTMKLKVTLTPKNTTQKKVTWSTSNKKVAKVSKNGKVTAVKKGKATITVKVNGTSKKAKCKVTVVCGHKYKTTTVKSTCVKKGYTLQKCEKCGVSKKTILPLEKHKYKGTTIDATCTQNGSIVKKCTECSQRTTKVLKAAHVYAETTVPATCTKDGSITKKCTKCEDTSTQVLKAKEHDYKNIEHKDSNCLTAGYQTDKCQICGDIRTIKYVKREHFYKLSASDVATCQQDGYRKYKCGYSDCSSEYTDVLPKIKCNYCVIDEVKASCTKAGYTKYRCSMCGDEYSDPIPMTKHDMWFEKRIYADCYTYEHTIWKCRYCDYTEERDWENEYYHAMGTVLETHLPENCIDEFYVERKCNDCGAIYREVYEPEEWRHEYELDHYTIMPDCEHTGRAVFKCSLCEKTKEEDVEELHDCAVTSSDLQYRYLKCKLCGDELKEYNDQEYTIDLGNGKTTTVVGHYDLEMAEEVFELLNEYRVSKGLYKFKKPAEDSALYQAALTRAVETYYIYDHERPNGKPLNSLVGGSTYGENLSVRGESAQELIQAWKNSPDHNKNMLNTVTSRCGVAIFCIKHKMDNGIGYRYSHRSVQVFGN